MKILVTGGCGYLGSILVQQLIQSISNVEIVVIDNFFHSHWHVTYPWISKYGNVKLLSKDVTTCDVSNYVRECDVWYCLHALVGQPLCDVDKNLAVATNYTSIINQISNLKKETVVIYPDSNSSYGTVDGICTEETKTNPLSLYAETKEKTGKVLLEQHNKTIVFKLATLFGVSPRMRLDLLVNSLVWDAFWTHKIELFEAGANRNYCHVNDVARIFSLSCLPQYYENMVGNVFNLGNDNINMSKGDLVSNIAKIVNAEISLCDKNDPDRRNYLVSSLKLKNKTGLEAEISLDTGIRGLVKYYSNLPINKQVRDTVCKIMFNV
jgi:nucleoside-diphosphate-sugar epimerase